MKSSKNLYIILVVIVIITTALIQASQPEKIVWNQTFALSEKQPYDLLIFNENKKSFFPASKLIENYNQPINNLFREEKIGNQDAILLIDNSLSKNNVTNTNLLKFAEKGGTVYLATYDPSYEILDTLGISTDYLSLNENNIDVNVVGSYLQYSGSKDSTYYAKTEYNQIFDKLNPKNTTILAYTIVGEAKIPSFVAVKYGKGTFYFNLNPNLFTNYYLLKKPNFEVAHQALSYLNGKNIYYVNQNYAIENSNTPLRVILSYPQTRYAWYTLLLTLLLMLVFRSKRTQKIIPVLEPEKNLSKEFATTIASVYYENGTPGNMIQKKIEHFLYNLRRNFNLDTQNLLDKQFIQQLSNKMQKPYSEIETFFKTIIQYKNKENSSIEELKKINQLIENFKEQANIK